MHDLDRGCLGLGQGVVGRKRNTETKWGTQRAKGWSKWWLDTAMCCKESWVDYEHWMTMAIWIKLKSATFFVEYPRSSHWKESKYGRSKWDLEAPWVQLGAPVRSRKLREVSFKKSATRKQTKTKTSHFLRVRSRRHRRHQYIRHDMNSWVISWVILCCFLLVGFLKWLQVG